MSQQNPIRLFVAHTWEETEDYLRIFEYLESARNFFYKNTSVLAPMPTGGPEAIREELRRQIGPAEILIASTGLYRTQMELLMFQIHFAKSANKPVLLLKPFGVQSVVPRALSELADDVVDWDERGMVDAIRRLARKENTARYDVIDFSPDDFKDFKVDD
jgi:hypothetical protein